MEQGKDLNGQEHVNKCIESDINVSFSQEAVTVGTTAPELELFVNNVCC